MSETATPRSLRFAGVDIDRWLFSLRIWIAVQLALGVAFWLQLDGASSAGVCVGILALRTRGQVLEKSIYRALGTVIGAAMAIAIAGVFSQVRDLYVLAYSAWLGLCVFAAGFLDGHRAYGAVLCGYTVSVVAVQHIDTPDQVFLGGLDRLAAILVGIASIALVNDLLAGPAIAPSLVARARSLQAKVRAVAAASPSREIDGEAAAIFRAVTDLHPEINALRTETLAGIARAGAARALAAALVGGVAARRALASARDDGVGDGGGLLQSLVRRRHEGEILAQDRASDVALAALQAGRPLPHATRMPIYRPWQNALRNGLRAFVTSVMAGYAFVLTGWPGTAVAWSLVGVMMCLSANSPDPRNVGNAAIIAMPCAALSAGITQFLILGGVDAFPLLGLGLAPGIFASTLLLSSPNPRWASIGSLTNTFSLVILAPSNPQSYDPQSYLTSAILAITGAFAVFASLHSLFPTRDADRRAWALASGRNAVLAALRRKMMRPEAEAQVLDASRIAALASLADATPARHAADLAEAFRLADLRAAVQRARRALERNGGLAQAEIISAAGAALARADPAGLRRSASTLAAQERADLLPAAADLAWTASLLDTSDRARGLAP